MRERTRQVIGGVILAVVVAWLSMQMNAQAGTTISNYCAGCYAVMPAWYCHMQGC